MTVWPRRTARAGKPIAAAALAMTALLMLTACQTTASVGTDTSCRAFGPIGWSRGDSVETVHQVRGHNAAWRELCARAKQ